MPIFQYSFADADMGRDQVKAFLEKQFAGDLSASWTGYKFAMRLGDKSKNLCVKGIVHERSVSVFHVGGKNRKGAVLKMKAIFDKAFPTGNLSKKKTGPNRRKADFQKLRAA